MLVLEEFQKTYTVASIYRGIFTKAIQQIFPGYSSLTVRSSPAATTAIPVPATETYAPGSMLEEENPDVNNYSRNDRLGDYGVAMADETDPMAFFMDEGSIFDFWQTWNQSWNSTIFYQFIFLVSLLYVTMCMMLHYVQYEAKEKKKKRKENPQAGLFYTDKWTPYEPEKRPNGMAYYDPGFVWKLKTHIYWRNRQYKMWRQMEDETATNIPAPEYSGIRCLTEAYKPFRQFHTAAPWYHDYHMLASQTTQYNPRSPQTQIPI